MTVLVLFHWWERCSAFNEFFIFAKLFTWNQILLHLIHFGSPFGWCSNRFFSFSCDMLLTDLVSIFVFSSRCTFYVRFPDNSFSFISWSFFVLSFAGLFFCQLFCFRRCWRNRCFLQERFFLFA
ncbi:hypothetical protein Tcan_01428 [Toxocara canis]|uniref:Uncharacterized protein n=1 Tax=Toxocara canis TaxID=6265 RepID=A0A0B2UXE0_TOXCA|nr:hypothetical protein Tcan_01428 [Toxocara canis]